MAGFMLQFLQYIYLYCMSSATSTEQEIVLINMFFKFICSKLCPLALAIGGGSGGGEGSGPPHPLPGRHTEAPLGFSSCGALFL